MNERLIKYVRENLAGADRVIPTIGEMCRERTPLYVANSRLHDDIYDLLETWCEENNEDVTNYDAEDVLFEL